MTTGRDRILVTGGATFIGRHIAAALLAEGATVQLLVRAGAEPLIEHLKDQLTWRYGDVWNPASLKGQARNVSTVIHTVGGVQADPTQGLTHHYLNFLSLRNVANMCVSSGAQRLIFISSVNAPWIPSQYIHAKREAERYMARVGLQGTVIRAPLLYQRGKSRPTVYRLISITAAITPLLHRIAPMPVDIFARGVARLAIQADSQRNVYYAGDLRRLNTPEERRGLPGGAQAKPQQPLTIDEPPLTEADTKPNRPVD